MPPRQTYEYIRIYVYTYIRMSLILSVYLMVVFQIHVINRVILGRTQAT